LALLFSRPEQFCFNSGERFELTGTLQPFVDQSLKHAHKLKFSSFESIRGTHNQTASVRQQALNRPNTQAMSRVYFALNLHLHQPSGNLLRLLNHDPVAAKQILRALDRIPKSLWPYEKTARLHLSLSGTLLEMLSNAEFQAKAYDIMRCGDFLYYLQNNKIFELLATAYYHPILPLVPPHDWEPQIKRWQGLGWHLFYKSHFSGFWPPELAVTMEMIPVLKCMGFRYVLVDSDNVEPVDDLSEEELLYRPHIARYGNETIQVIVRNRALSQALEWGLAAEDFILEVEKKTRGLDFPALIFCGFNGDNGELFRNSTGTGNFWTQFYPSLMRGIEAHKTQIQPTFLTEYLDRYGARSEVRLKPGTWSLAEAEKGPYYQWAGNKKQKEALACVHHISRCVHRMRQDLRQHPGHPDNIKFVKEAQWRVLRSQTSCNFFWGGEWLKYCHEDLQAAESWLNGILIDRQSQIAQ